MEATLTQADFPSFVDAVGAGVGCGDGGDGERAAHGDGDSTGWLHGQCLGWRLCCRTARSRCCLETHKMCTITNDDVAPTLTLVKTVVNDNGGDADASGLPVVRGCDVAQAWDVATAVTANVQHTATETPQDWLHGQCMGWRLCCRTARSRCCLETPRCARSPTTMWDRR